MKIRFEKKAHIRIQDDEDELFWWWIEYEWYERESCWVKKSWNSGFNEKFDFSNTLTEHEMTILALKCDAT